MAFRISEYACGPLSGRAQSPGIVELGLNTSTALSGPIQSQSGSSAGATFRLSAATRMVLIDSDFGALFVFGSSLVSTSAGPTVTSTNGQHVAPNIAPIPFYVQPGTTIFMASS